MKKILIIRFSSFGDIVQSLSCVNYLKTQYPEAKIDFLTKLEFKALVSLQEGVDEVIGFDKKQGLKGLIELAASLREREYSLIYDAHLNLRSSIFKCFLLSPFYKFDARLVERSKHRLKRILYFKFKVNLFPSPNLARKSFIFPLETKLKLEAYQPTVLKWNFSQKVILGCRDRLKSNVEYVSLVLGANWDLKRWPVKYWAELISNNPTQHFVLLGAGLEESLAKKLEEQFQSNVTNLVSKLSLVESCYVLSKSKSFISADTGLLHVADSLGVGGYALLGPTAFGYPSSMKIKVLEDSELKCRPCSKDGSGKCSQAVYKRCMVNLPPEMIQF